LWNKLSQSSRKPSSPSLSQLVAKKTRSISIDLTYNAPKPGGNMNPKEFKNAVEGNLGE